MFRELVTYRELLFALTLKEIRVRYKQSVMGFLWALLMPLLIVLSGVMVKEAFAVVRGQRLDLHEVLGVCVRALPWAFFVGAVRFGTASLLANSNLVSKIYFPREILPIAAVFANFFDFLIASSALTVLLLVARVGASVYLLWLPVLVVLLVLFTSSLALLLSCANLFFRDVKYIVEVLLTFGIFFTPVFYEARMLGRWAPLLMLNPLSTIIEGFADVVIHHRSPDLSWLGYAAVMSVMMFFVSTRIFERSEAAFAESI
ncbi:MAG TPA: ABC transporter permease [Terriglobales bacterium]|nr:ABC transporter permease [Terriglobales bacterium]